MPARSGSAKGRRRVDRGVSAVLGGELRSFGRLSARTASEGEETARGGEEKWPQEVTLPRNPPNGRSSSRAPSTHPGALSVERGPNPSEWHAGPARKASR